MRTDDRYALDDNIFPSHIGEGIAFDVDSPCGLKSGAPAS
jgi:hypothetical protein